MSACIPSWRTLEIIWYIILHNLCYEFAKLLSSELLQFELKMNLKFKVFQTINFAELRVNFTIFQMEFQPKESEIWEHTIEWFLSTQLSPESADFLSTFSHRQTTTVFSFCIVLMQFRAHYLKCLIQIVSIKSIQTGHKERWAHIKEERARLEALLRRRNLVQQAYGDVTIFFFTFYT